MDVSYLKECVNYDPISGELVFKVRPRKHFSSCRSMKSWNTKYAGKVAGCVKEVGKHKTPYRYVSISGKKFKNSRVAWAITTGKWPKYQVDHLDHNTLNDTWVNLEDKTHKENGRNQKIRSTNKSGVMGIRFDRGKWRADICVNAKNIYLGRYEEKQDAVAARRAAEIKYGFHENHNGGKQ